MGCSTNGKGDKQKSGKTARGAKGGGKGSGGGAKTGKGRGAGVQDAPAWAKQIVNELANLKKKAEGKVGWKEVKNGKFWTCPAGATSGALLQGALATTAATRGRASRKQRRRKPNRRPQCRSRRGCQQRQGQRTR